MSKSISLFIVVLLFACCIFFSKCQKEYSYEGGPIGNTTASAVFTCTGITVMGNYYTATSLDQTNTVQLQVNVTIAGTFNVSTNTSNGIKFSASGIFTSMGLQTITLNGSGSPVATGAFNFNPSASTVCSFTITVITAPVIMAGYTLEGAPGDCTNANVKGNYVSMKPLTISNFVDVSVKVISAGAYTLTTDTIDGINFSASGTFTTTGVQTVTLTGSGTPVGPGNLVFTPINGASHCTFDITVVNPDPLATYVLESGFGNPTPCIHTIEGNYTVNIPLSNSNFISMRVFVTVPGNFTIATNKIDGIMFSFTGTFTTLGSQLLQLTGSGTPAASGTYSFFPQIVGPHPLGGQSCAVAILIN
jgi:hypothetical protein